MKRAILIVALLAGCSGPSPRCELVDPTTEDYVARCGGGLVAVCGAQLVRVDDTGCTVIAAAPGQPSNIAMCAHEPGAVPTVPACDGVLEPARCAVPFAPSDTWCEAAFTAHGRPYITEIDDTGRAVGDPTFL